MSTNKLKLSEASIWSLENLFFELISMIDSILKLKNENGTG